MIFNLFKHIRYVGTDLNQKRTFTELKEHVTIIESFEPCKQFERIIS
jgi:hypothetical protein